MLTEKSILLSAEMIRAYNDQRRRETGIASPTDEIVILIARQADRKFVRSLSVEPWIVAGPTASMSGCKVTYLAEDGNGNEPDPADRFALIKAGIMVDGVPHELVWRHVIISDQVYISRCTRTSHVWSVLLDLCRKVDPYFCRMLGYARDADRMQYIVTYEALIREGGQSKMPDHYGVPVMGGKMDGVYVCTGNEVSGEMTLVYGEKSREAKTESKFTGLRSLREGILSETLDEEEAD